MCVFIRYASDSMDTSPLTQVSSLMPLIEKIATDIATKIVNQTLDDAKYNVPQIPDHHHNGVDSTQLEPISNTAFENLSATTGSVLAPATLGNQVVGQDSNLVGYGTLKIVGNQTTSGIFTTCPIPVIYGNGVGADSAFNGGTAPIGTLIFFNNGNTLSGLWCRTQNGWYRMAVDGSAPIP